MHFWNEHKICDLDLIETSIAGVGSCVAVPQFKLCFDVAQGLPFAYGLKHYLVTHAHMDHAGGIPYIISQRCLNGLAPGKFYVGEEMIKPLEMVLKGWLAMEHFEYSYEFIPVEEGIKYEINGTTYFKIFPTVHRVPSRGYCIYKSSKRLKSEFKNLHPEEIKSKAQSGVEVNESTEVPLIAYTGDTQIEFLDLSKDVKQAKVLILEATYLDPMKSVQGARDWGHTHLDEIIPRLKELSCEHIVFGHISSRYPFKKAQEIIRKRLLAEAPDWVDRFSVFAR